MEDQRLIVSIPSALHSQKPSLSGQYFQHVSVCHTARYIEYSAVMCFTMPPEGNAATSVIVISPSSFNDKHQVLLQPAVADLASKGVSQLFRFAWLKFKMYHFDFIPCYKTSCKLITTMCFCMRNEHFKVITLIFF